MMYLSIGCRKELGGTHSIAVKFCESEACSMSLVSLSMVVVVEREDGLHEA